jgi:hypothetical protein
VRTLGSERLQYQPNGAAGCRQDLPAVRDHDAKGEGTDDQADRAEYLPAVDEI